MKKILVHLHLYYYDQLDYFIEKLSNISDVKWDLIITYAARNEEAFEKIRQFKPEVVFLESENYGYDLWPFIKAIKSVELDNYDYVVKLHTKRSVDRARINKIWLHGFEWRDALVDGVLANNKYFKKVLKRLEKDPEVGLIANLVTIRKSSRVGVNTKVWKEMQRLGLESSDSRVNLGTMFIARADIFKPLQSNRVNVELFMDHKPGSNSDGYMAHAYEEILSLLPSAQGKKLIGMSPYLGQEVSIRFQSFIEPPFKWLFSMEREGDEKRKYYRICGIKFKTKIKKHEA